MPSGLFVCVSWISFVVPIDAIPGRMALLVTLLLVMINMFNSSVEKEPLPQYITALSGKHGSGYLKLKGIKVFPNFKIFGCQNIKIQDNINFRLALVVHLLCLWCTFSVCSSFVQKVPFKNDSMCKSYECQAKGCDIQSCHIARSRRCTSNHEF